MSETLPESPNAGQHLKVRSRKKKSLQRRLNRRMRKIAKKRWFFYVLIGVAAVIIGYLFFDLDLTVERRGRKVDLGSSPIALLDYGPSSSWPDHLPAEPPGPTPA
jgi:hypothetical protein